VKSIIPKLAKSGVTITWLVVVFLFLGVVGCVSTRSGKSTRFQVIPVSSQDVAALSSDDVVRVMRRAGFSDGQILEHGTDLYDALSQSGAAQVRTRRGLRAVFAINGDSVYISSRFGNFIYNINTGWVGR